MNDQIKSGDCGRFCEACARRDDEIKRLREAVMKVMENLRNKDAGVLRSGLRDNDSSRDALKNLFDLVHNKD
jgi:hypothetical protein